MSVSEGIALRKEITSTLMNRLPDLSDETALRALQALANALGEFANELDVYGKHMSRATRQAIMSKANNDSRIENLMVRATAVATDQAASPLKEAAGDVTDTEENGYGSLAVDPSAWSAVTSALGRNGLEEEALREHGLLATALFFATFISEGNVIGAERAKARAYRKNMTPEQGESLTAYCSRIRSWFDNIPPLKGMPSEESVIDRLGETLEKHLLHAQWIELSREAGYTGFEQPSSLNVIVRAASRMGHLGIVLRREAPKKSRTAGAQAAAATANPATTRRARPDTRTCYRCHEPGHIRRNCPQKRRTKRCGACNSTEHALAACPILAAGRAAMASADIESADEYTGEQHGDAEPEGEDEEEPNQWISARLSGPLGFYEANGLIDSGSTFSLISMRTAYSLGLDIEGNLTALERSTVDIGKRTLLIIGAATLPLVLADEARRQHTFLMRVLVVPDMVADLIIGWRFLKDEKAFPVAHQDTLVITGKGSEDIRIPMHTGIGRTAAVATPTIARKTVTKEDVTFGKDVTREQRERTLRVLNKYPALVLGTTPRRFTSLEKATVVLMEGAEPFWRASRPRSAHERKILQAELDALEDAGYLRKVPESERTIDSHPWSLPVFLVKKAGKVTKYDDNGNPLPGSMRVVQDARELNKRCAKEYNEKLSVRSVLDAAGKRRYWTRIDFDKAFHQVMLREEDRAKMAFSLDTGELYEFVAMSMGWINAPSVWNRVMARALGPMLQRVAFWMDDAVMGCDDIDEGIEQLEQLLKRLDEAGLTISLPKLELFVDETEFVGLTISEEGIGIKETAKDLFRTMERPTTTAALRSFLGAVQWFAAWIPQASAKSNILSMCMRKGHRLEWNAERIAAFESLRDAIADAEPLAHAAELEREGTTPVVATDASVRAVGAVLSVRDAKGTSRVVAYAARAFAERELSAGVPDKELAAVVHALTKFEPYLDGRRFELQTDSRAVKGMIESEDPPPDRKRARWLAFIRSFTFNVVHVPGESNGGADALSRLILNRPDPEWEAMAAEEDTRVERRIKRSVAAPVTTRSQTASRDNAHMETVMAALLFDSDDEEETDEPQAGSPEPAVRAQEDTALTAASQTRRRRQRATAGPHRGPRTFTGEWRLGPVPPRTTLTYIRKLKEDHARHHLGRDAMVHRAMAQGWSRPGTHKWAQLVADGCAGCLASKPYRSMHGAPGAAVTAGVELPNQRWSIDHAGPFTWGAEQHKHWVLVAVDAFSGYTMVGLIAERTARAVIDVLEGMFNAENVRTPRYPAKGAPRRAEGLRGPDHIHADREKSFMSAEMRRWAAQPERAILVTAAAKGHPQGNGMAEKHVQNIKRATMASGWHKPLTDTPHSWFAVIRQVVNEYNSTPREYDRRPGHSVVSTPYALFKGSDPQGTRHEATVADRRAGVVAARRAQEIEGGGLNAASRTTKAFKVGDEVWWRTPEGATHGPRSLKKFKYEGPYIVTSIKTRHDQTGGTAPPRVPLTYVIRHAYVRSSRDADEHKVVSVQDLRPGATMRLAGYLTELQAQGAQ